MDAVRSTEGERKVVLGAKAERLAGFAGELGVVAVVSASAVVVDAEVVSLAARNRVRSQGAREALQIGFILSEGSGLGRVCADVEACLSVVTSRERRTSAKVDGTAITVNRARGYGAVRAAVQVDSGGGAEGSFVVLAVHGVTVVVDDRSTNGNSSVSFVTQRVVAEDEGIESGGISERSLSHSSDSE